MPVTAADIAAIPHIVENADRIENAGKSPQGLDVIRHVMRTNGVTYYVEEARTGRRTVSLVTMYKRGAATPDAPASRQSPAQTSETFRGPVKI